MTWLWRHILAARLAYALWRAERHLGFAAAWKLTARDAQDRLRRPGSARPRDGPARGPPE